MAVSIGAASCLAVPSSAHAAESLPVDRAVAALPGATESREGYEPAAFAHWNSGSDAGDACDTQGEVLIAEAVSAPETGAECALSGGTWWSYYDGREVDSAAALAVDHLVPTAEAWDSGASGWTAERREQYANDQGDPRVLVAVSAAAHRDKADQDPAQWLPADPGATCRYLTEWVAVKLRWQLTADAEEQRALTRLAEGCQGAEVTYEPVP
ncbi:HNH endonuclease family protein [Streptomyces sp. CRN 30]|uniref:HNH endonuclease family protein n=1 Tax=Streptomyces sp. CRN 30 TaxID=3075613 RepID=UPI002A7FFC30|nr:HNH endonuclease family protein [Streptomyces sp. CRN 30]